MRSLTLVLFCALALSLPAAAQDKKEGGGFDDLFGDSLSGAKKGGMDDLKDAAKGGRAKSSAGGLVPKGRSTAGESGVQFLEAFIAERIVITKKEGCIPAGQGRVKLTYFEFDGDVPVITADTKVDDGPAKVETFVGLDERSSFAGMAEKSRQSAGMDPNGRY